MAKEGKTEPSSKRDTSHRKSNLMELAIYCSSHVNKQTVILKFFFFKIFFIDRLIEINFEHLSAIIYHINFFHVFMKPTAIIWLISASLFPLSSAHQQTLPISPLKKIPYKSTVKPTRSHMTISSLLSSLPSSPKFKIPCFPFSPPSHPLLRPSPPLRSPIRSPQSTPSSPSLHTP